MFIFELKRLFDGSVSQRASAERQIQMLRQWVTKMWEAAKEYRGADSFADHPLSHWAAGSLDKEYDVLSEMWRLWALTESIRRTHIVVDTVANTYQTMTRGWADCTGTVMVTARRGLWEAESAEKWFELSRAKNPLLVPSLQPGSLLSKYTAEEVDDSE